MIAFNLIAPIELSRAGARARGFSLVEMALVLLIVGLLAAVFLPATNTLLDNNRRKETRAKLEALEQAMVRFVMVNGRLPCPADGDLPLGNVNQGLELAAGGVCTALALTNGVVPWRNLGLSQADATDAWGTIVSYKVWGGAGVASSLTLADGMNMQALDPTNSGAVKTWLSTRGFRACNAAACAVGSAAELASKADGNGVAYFLISHGPNRFGGFSADGNYLGTPQGTPPGPLENINRSTVPLRSAVPNDDYYVDADFAENPAAYYDDLVLRPTILSVAMAAGLGPRRP
ncbi:MAG: type II secretion system protein [Giesbergeria sp.]